MHQRTRLYYLSDLSALLAISGVLENASRFERAPHRIRSRDKRNSVRFRDLARNYKVTRAYSSLVNVDIIAFVVSAVSIDRYKDTNDRTNEYTMYSFSCEHILPPEQKICDLTDYLACSFVRSFA